MNNAAKLPRVVIVGGGFGGLSIVRSLKNKKVEVLLIDRHNYHTFQPLLYQVATGGLEPDSIAYPLRRSFRKYRNVFFRMAEAMVVNLKNNTLETSIGVLAYDYLVIASGSQTNFFQLEDMKDKMLQIKTVPDALDFRSFLMQNLEKAIITEDEAERERIMNIAIVGGGPTGVELAGALAEMRRYVFPRDLPELNLEDMHIFLFEAESQLLAAMSDESSEAALKYLEKLGIEVFLDVPVTGYDGEKITLKNGKEIPTETVIWTAGVKCVPLKGLPEEAIKGPGRIAVDEFNRVEGIENIFVIGDAATHMTDETPKGLPMLAQVAIQQGEAVGKNILKSLEGKPMVPFTYTDKGTMATVGRKKAVVDLPRFKFQGFFAWIVWMMVHIYSLIGFRNKVVTFIDWVSNYISYDRPLGLIIRPFKRGQ